MDAPSDTVDGENEFMSLMPYELLFLIKTVAIDSVKVADCGDGGASMDSCSALLTVWPTKALDTVRLAETLLQHRVVALTREASTSVKLVSAPSRVLAEQYTL